MAKRTPKPSQEKRRLAPKYILRRVLLALVCLALLGGLIYCVVNVFAGGSGQQGRSAASSQSSSSSSSSQSGSGSSATDPSNSSDESSQSSETPSVPATNAEPTSATDPAAWNLVLVNRDRPLSATNFQPELTYIEETGYRFHAWAVDSLNEMLSAARSDAVYLQVLSSYRSYETQFDLYWNEVQRLQDTSYGQQQAEEKAAEQYAIPGTSEHCTGLGVDLVPLRNEYKLDETFTDLNEYQWLVSHCAKYGFIPRYPAGCEEHTHMTAEPWHFRYVGVEAAQEIVKQGVCLEEYLQKLGK